MTPEQQAAVLADLVEQLRGAMVIRVAPPGNGLGGEWSRLADMVDQTAAKLPAKYRADVLKLERRIATELNRFFVASLEAGNLVAAAGSGDSARWAYQCGVLTSLILQFTGRPVPAPGKGGGR